MQNPYAMHSFVRHPAPEIAHSMLRRPSIVFRVVLDTLTIDIELHDVIQPIDLSCRPWRDQDLLSGPPVLRGDDKVTNAPIFILHEKVLDVTYLAVAGMYMVSGHTGRAPCGGLCRKAASAHQVA